MSQTHGTARGTIPRVVRALIAGARAQRAAHRAERRARMLTGLEQALFGHRMPDPAVTIATARWAPEALEASCARCGTTLAPFEARQEGCGACAGKRLPYRALIRLGPYSPPLSQWVPAIKSRAWIRMGEHLGALLGTRVLDAVGAGRLDMPDAVVSVPIHWLRRLTRGLDHGALIADAVAAELGIPRVGALRVVLATRQTGGDGEGRRSNLGRFRATSAASQLEGKRVLLVDDVRTTGSTLRDAARVIRAHGASEVAAAVCTASDPPARRSIARNGVPRGP